MHPGKTFEYLVGTGELVKIATVLGQYATDVENQLMTIRGTADDLLRAELLTFFAKGLAQRLNSSSTPLT